MAFDTYEKSRHEGSRFELYKFETEDGLHVWTYTTDKSPFTFNFREYKPEVIQRSEVQQSTAEGAGQRLTVMVPYNNPVAVLHVPYLPPRPVRVTIYAVHRRDAAVEVKQCFVGYIAGFAQKKAVVEFLCSHIIDSQQQRVPWQVYKSSCVWALYEEGCGVQRSLFRTNVENYTADGLDLVSESFTPLGDNWFRSGKIFNPATGEERFIVAHTGNRITLLYPFIGLAPEIALIAYAGCDRKPTTCKVKFDNKLNYLGFDRLPDYNVFDGGVR